MEDRNMSEDAINEKLTETGMGMARAWLESAIKTAKNSEMMNNQIAVLNVASISVIAHRIYNDIVQSNRTLEECVEEVTDALVKLVLEMKSNQGLAEKVYYPGGEDEEKKSGK
jgi:hypothetical protein